MLKAEKVAFLKVKVTNQEKGRNRKAEHSQRLRANLTTLKGPEK
jgi:hypothetical protein